MYPASRFALPAALSLSLSSLAVSAALADGPAPTPALPLPGGPQPLPIAGGDPGLLAPSAARPRSWRETLPLSFGEKFTQILQREASGHMDLASVPLPSAAPATETITAVPGDGGSDRRVKRLLTRALRGVLDEQLETLTQNAPFATFLRRGPAREESSAEPTAAPEDATRRRFDASLGMRLDAHPRVQWRTTFGSFSGIVEVPVVDPELRVGVERPLGAVGRAALRAGAGGARGDWASLNFSFGF